MTANEVVLRIGFEGGSIALWRTKDLHGSWKYAVATDESVLAKWTSNEKEGLVRTPERWVDSFDAGMHVLERYPWRQGYPRDVHPDYGHLLWEHVIAKRVAPSMVDQWAEVCHVNVDMRVVTLVDWLLRSRCTVVLSGAGLSTASGVPDFRSPTGWWRGIDPTTVATAAAVEYNYETFHEFYSARIHALTGLEPNEGHRIIAKWEREGLVHAVATQNVDGFHQMAGSQNVYELHGSIRAARCSKCGHEASEGEFLNRTPCAACGSPLRPNVTLFDELLPEKAWERALDAIGSAALVLILGTSLNVQPANSLPTMTKARTVVVNREPTSLDEQFNLVIHGNLELVLPSVEEWLSRWTSSGKMW